MARIRTIKPEAFTSESLAEVTVEAERTFFGLLTQADDHGRHRDNAAIIAGLLWPLRAEHTSVHVEDDLQQLANAGLVCRYTGCDGRRYLHVVTWHQHQKIDRPSQSRLPACPQHHAADRCGSCKGVCAKGTEASPSSARGFADVSTNPPGALDRTAPPSPGPAAPRDAASLPHQPALADPDAASGPTQDDVAGQTAFADNYPSPPRGLAEASGTGSRILDPGSSFPTGREAPAAQASAGQLLGEYISACDKRPPSDVIGHLGRITKRLLAEGIDPQDIRTGLSRFAANPKHPSVLTSMVNEAMNSRSAGLAGPGSGPNVPAHRAWTNPVDAAAAYAEEL